MAHFAFLKHPPFHPPILPSFTGHPRGGKLSAENQSSSCDATLSPSSRSPICATSCWGLSPCRLKKGHRPLCDLDPHTSCGRSRGHMPLTYWKKFCSSPLLWAEWLGPQDFPVPSTPEHCPALHTLAIMNRAQAFNPGILCIHFSY